MSWTIGLVDTCGLRANRRGTGPEGGRSGGLRPYGAPEAIGVPA
jgi:hypothetical protein